MGKGRGHCALNPNTITTKTTIFKIQKKNGNGSNDQSNESKDDYDMTKNKTSTRTSEATTTSSSFWGSMPMTTYVGYDGNM